jgi:hypothetical protein
MTHPSTLSAQDVIDAAQALDRLASSHPELAAVLHRASGIIHNQHAALIMVRAAIRNGAGK